MLQVKEAHSGPDTKNIQNLESYVASLRGLASTCEFGAFEEEAIRDQLGNMQLVTVFERNSILNIFPEGCHTYC